MISNNIKWYTSWEKLAEENEIYVLIIERTVDIQGLIAIAPHKNMQAVYIRWMCTAPQNNKLITADVKHYVEKLNAEVIRMLHPYQFAVDETNARQIMELLIDNYIVIFRIDEAAKILFDILL